MYIGTGGFEATDLMKKYLDDILDSGQLSYGQYSKQFEQSFSTLHDCKYGILSNSGTSSLLVALQAMKELYHWQDGDEVIVPTITFVATVNVVLQSGLRPVLVDVESDYYGIDTLKIGEAITDRTRCIIPVHTFGQPCDMLKLVNVLYGIEGLKSGRVWSGNKIKVIEDSCESMFVNQSGKSVGLYGHIVCFSFYMAHLLTTGVGGMSITNSPELAQLMRSLVNHGLAYSDLSSTSITDNFNPQQLSRQFEFDRIGHSFRITELEAAIGLAQLQTYKDMIESRQDNAKYLLDGLQDLGDRIQLPRTRPNTEHAWMMFPVVCKDFDTRDKLCHWLNEKGIGTRRMLPLVSQPCYRGLWNPNDYPVARWIDDNGYYFGCHQHLSKEQLDYIIDAHWEYFS